MQNPKFSFQASQQHIKKQNNTDITEKQSLPLPQQKKKRRRRNIFPPKSQIKKEKWKLKRVRYQR